MPLPPPGAHDFAVKLEKREQFKFQRKSKYKIKNKVHKGAFKKKIIDFSVFDKIVTYHCYHFLKHIYYTHIKNLFFVNYLSEKGSKEIYINIKNEFTVTRRYCL